MKERQDSLDVNPVELKLKQTSEQ